VSPLAVGWLRTHWPLKLLSIVVAVTLWVFVVSADLSEAVYTIPLDVTGVPAGLQIASVGVDTVVVRVRGRRSILSRLRDEDFRAEVSVKDAPGGRFVSRLGPDNISAPVGVRVLRVSPSQVRTTLEPAPR